MITGILPKGMVYLHVNNISRYPSTKKEGIGINEQNTSKCGVSDKKLEETHYSLLHNPREGQLHGSIQSKLESVMEDGQENHWPAKLQI